MVERPCIRFMWRRGDELAKVFVEPGVDDDDGSPGVHTMQTSRQYSISGVVDVDGAGKSSACSL